MRFLTAIITILLLIVGVAFAALNAKSVPINYLLGSTELPLAVILLISLALGILLTAMTMGFSVLKLKAKNKWLENKLKTSHSVD